MTEQELDTNAKTDVSYYLELKQELTALRAWKEKARPFLIYAKQELEAELEQFGSVEIPQEAFISILKND
jgi:hypothetical protein